MRMTLRTVAAAMLILPVCAFADTASRAAEGVKPKLKGWVRQGELGAKPKRVTDAYPLSDQANEGNWLRHAPMSDEFQGKNLDDTRWWPKNPSWAGRKPALFDPANVSVSDGKLHLAMRKGAAPENEDLRRPGYHTYTSYTLPRTRPTGPRTAFGRRRRIWPTRTMSTVFNGTRSGLPGTSTACWFAGSKTRIGTSR